MVDDSRSSISRGEAPIAFGKRLASSELFRDLFREGMALIEETAGYLDGNGREESRRLTRAGSLAYATESMRLTTRLMQLASWLLVQRAVNEGEMSAEQASLERAKVKLAGFASATEGPGWDGLPERLRELILRSIKLQDRVRALDGALGPGASEPTENPVARQLGELARVFGAAHK